MSRLSLSALSCLLVAAVVLALTPFTGLAQATGRTSPSASTGVAHISEEVRTLETYPFSEPNPVPILTRDPRLYPYHSFEGYSVSSRPQEWKVVKLENEFIEVYVLPEVGGKVWGAIVKETGHEFIYRNEVMKFRNIALRGPWTSGGIEFNFGVIGHAPSTATPINYQLLDNPDGSVSCWVGTMDLPSRTHWRVEIRLPADRAYFETNVLWYNPTPLEQPYYNWMTAAAFAQNDLEMAMPGNAYLRHSGQAEEWPVDEQGRYLPLYANNTFGGHKSYHVVGELNDFFGGYYHDAGYGFGHWARHEDMPGQKLWLWALSREGGVWEDLLTDTDGQYVEFQAGRLFVQYSPGSAVNPITQARFEPMSTSRWTETWFPLEGIGGLTDASKEGALHAMREGDQLTVRLNAFGEIQDTLKVWAGNELALSQSVALEALEPFEAKVNLGTSPSFRIQLPSLNLDYTSDPSQRLLSRPFETDPTAWDAISKADRANFQANELMKAREYAQARGLFREVLREQPWSGEALLGLAELSYRSGLYETGLENVNRALQLDAYDARANFLAGILHRALHHTADARDAFGWAARSVAYRAAANTQLAEIMMKEGDLDEVERYLRLALDFDRQSIPATRLLAVLERAKGDRSSATVSVSPSPWGTSLALMDPLDPLPRAEAFLTSPGPLEEEELRSSLGGEFPDQNLLELALSYERWGLRQDAVTLLGLAAGTSWTGEATPELVLTPVLRAWVAWLTDDPALLSVPGNPAFAFPYRSESIPVLEWAVQNDDSWVWTYLLALNLWAVDRKEDAAYHLVSLGQTPQFGPMYVARAHLLEATQGGDPGADLARAVELAPAERTHHIHLIRHYQETGSWDAALEALERAKALFPQDFNLDLLQARALIHSDKAPAAVRILASTHVLPSEHAREAHHLFEQAHLLVALDALEEGDFITARDHLLAALEWPESLGQGRPYDPEERLIRFLLGRAFQGMNHPTEAAAAFESVVVATGDLRQLTTTPAGGEPGNRLDLLALPALIALEGSSPAGAGVWASVEPREYAQWLAREFPQLFTDLDGKILLRALQAPAGNGP